MNRYRIHTNCVKQYYACEGNANIKNDFETLIEILDRKIVSLKFSHLNIGGIRKYPIRFEESRKLPNHGATSCSQSEQSAPKIKLLCSST